MSTINVTTRDGTCRAVPAVMGISIMEIVRDAGIADMVAICGGTLSCATCHVYVEKGDMNRLPQPTAEEKDMLDVAEDRRPNSRLSCQLRFVPSLDGLNITMAP